MGVSQGVGFPSGNIGPGAIHIRKSDGLILLHIGGNPFLESNWRAIGGVTDGDPDTSQWGTDQEGAFWYDRSLNAQRCWNGSVIATLGVSDDWTAYTPTVTAWTNATAVGFFKRDGDNMDVSARINLSASPAGSNPGLSMPAGFAVDTAKIAGGAGTTSIGTVNIFDLSPSAIYMGVVVIAGPFIIPTFFDTTTGTLVRRINVDVTSPITFVAGDTVTMNWSVPVIAV